MIELVVSDPAESIVSDTLAYISERPQSEVHISLTGGQIGTTIANKLLAVCAENPRIHFWFSDERFVPAGDEQRNEPAADSLRRCAIHSIAASDEVETAAEAAAKYSAEIHQVLTTRFCSDNTLMDICILSIGPDGHIASLFPHHPALDETLGVIAVTDSPKPPASRVTWTYPTINASRNVWLVATGAEKANAIAALRAEADLHEMPAAGAHGKQETRLYLDAEASSLV